MKKIRKKCMNLLTRIKDIIYRIPHKICFILSIFTAFISFFSCELPTWNQPVRAWFEEYTNTAAIGNYEIINAPYTDGSGKITINSYEDRTIKYYMRNPQKYNLILSCIFDDESISDFNTSECLKQTASDEITLIFTEDFLKKHDCGDNIGHKITLKEQKSGRDFKPFHMDLNCNSAPPAVKGQSVQSAGGKYVVCFYIPDADLESERHSRNTHTLYIDGTSIASGTTAEIISASSARPAGLSPVGNGGTFLETPPDGCTAFYFETNIPVMDNDDRSWTIHLTDDAGFSSASVTAYTKAPPVSAALTGESTITTADTTELEMSLEDYSGNVTCTWKSEDESIATVTADSSNSSKATVNPIAGGITTITVQTELADGRMITKSMEIHVLSLSLECPSDLLKGQAARQMTVTALGFPGGTPEYTWNTDTSVVVINEGENTITGSGKGKADITVSASYGGKTVSATKQVTVHALKLTGDSEVFENKTLTLTAALDSPSGATAPTVNWEWKSNNTSIASVSNGTVTPVSGKNGSVTITATAKLNGSSASLTKTISVYNLVVPSTIYIEKGKSESVTAAIESVVTGSSTSIRVTNGNSYVEKTQTGELKGKAVGTTTITATGTLPSGNQTTKNITVVVFELTLSGDIFYKAGSSTTGTVTASLSGYTGPVSYTWATNDPYKRSIELQGSEEKSRTVVPKNSAGSKKITVTAEFQGNNIKKVITVYVCKVSIKNALQTEYIVGETNQTLEIEYMGFPDDATPVVSWNSSKPGIATVTKKTDDNGNLNILAQGTSALTATVTYTGTSGTYTLTSDVMNINAYTITWVEEGGRDLSEFIGRHLDCSHSTDWKTKIKLTPSRSFGFSSPAWNENQASAACIVEFSGIDSEGWMSARFWRQNLGNNSIYIVLDIYKDGYFIPDARREFFLCNITYQNP